MQMGMATDEIFYVLFVLRNNGGKYRQENRTKIKKYTCDPAGGRHHADVRTKKGRGQQGICPTYVTSISSASVMSMASPRLSAVALRVICSERSRSSITSRIRSM